MTVRLACSIFKAGSTCSVRNNAFRLPLIPLVTSGELMPLEDSRRAYRNDFMLAAAMVVAGLVMCALALVELSNHNHVMAQATPPLQSSPPTQDKAPAESKPGGQRPTTPAPEPARPDPQAQKEGAKAALPPAPAEKMAPPIKEK
jgi:hypothetical protein